MEDMYNSNNNGQQINWYKIKNKATNGYNKLRQQPTPSYQYVPLAFTVCKLTINIVQFNYLFSTQLGLKLNIFRNEER